MIELQLGDIMAAELALSKLIEFSKDSEKNIPFKVAYKLNRIVKAVQPEIKDFYEERENLLKKYGEKVEAENGEGSEQYIVSPENREKFQKYLMQLTEYPVTLNVNKFSVEELNLIVGLSIAEIAGLDAFIEDEEDLDNVERKKIAIVYDDEEKTSEQS